MSNNIEKHQFGIIHRKTIYELLTADSEVSTVAGLEQIFEKNQTTIGKIYWITGVISLLILGSYWSLSIYQQWQSQQVLTVLTSTAIPVENMPFPSVTVCIAKHPLKFLKAAIIRWMQESLAQSRIISNFQFTPYEVAVINESMDLFKTQYTQDQKAELNFYETPFAKIKGLLSNEIFKDYNINSKQNIYTIEKTFNLFTAYDPDSIDLEFLMVMDQTMMIKLAYKYITPFQYYMNSSALNILKMWPKKASPANYPSSDVVSLKYEKIFNELMPILWYSKLPCFDIMNLTGLNENDSSFIKRCIWRGKPISCSAIFSAFPTDQDLCCTFNLQAADEMFTGEVFADMIKMLQTRDKQLSFSNSTLPWGFSNVKSMFGINKGLHFTLDSHSNLHTGKMITQSNFESLLVSIHAQGEFPSTIKGGFKIEMGYHNLIALKGSMTDSDKSINSIPAGQRGCYFEEEKSLKLFKLYSQANCFFECELMYSQELARRSLNLSTTCTPWYLPFVDQKQLTCDPYVTKKIVDLLTKPEPKTLCSYCLPNCNKVSYSYSLSKERFKSCNDFSLRMSPLCSVNMRTNDYKPNLWSEEVIVSMVNSCQLKREYLENISRSLRFKIARIGIFDSVTANYNAYSKDIAAVSIFFDSSTFVKFTRISASNWITYLSNVGGSYGICIGFSFSTIFEIFWLIIQITIRCFYFAKDSWS